MISNIKIWALVLLTAGTAITGYSQAPVEQKTKRTGKEIRELRQEKEREYIAWERKYFNSPGKWFINAKAGYGWPMQIIKSESIAPFEFLGESAITISPSGMVNDELILTSDGHGARIAIGVGMMFNRFIGFELELGYINEIRKSRASFDTPTFQSDFESDLFELYTDPLLVFQSPNMNNFYLYGRIGPHIAHWGLPRAYADVDDREGRLISGILFDPYQDILESILGLPITQDILELVDYRGTLKADTKIYLQQDFKDYPVNEIFRGIGINASFGFRYQATPIVSVFAEARIMGFNVSVAQAIIEDLDASLTIFGGAISIMELTEDGGTFLGETIRKEEVKSLLEVIYVNDYDETANHPVHNPDIYNSYLPRTELAPRLSVMSIGLQVGLQINFSGKDITYKSK